MDDTIEVMREAHKSLGLSRYYAVRPDDHIHDCADCKRVLLAPGTWIASAPKMAASCAKWRGYDSGGDCGREQAHLASALRAV